jgi:flagellar basal-body rod protein FlgB
MLLSQIDSITPKVIEFALDGLSLRHKAIASNIANVNSVDYRPISVSFENQIDSIRNDFYSDSAKNTRLNFEPVINFEKPRFNNTNVGIDMSAVELNQNVIQYHALIKGMDYYISTLSLAIKEGRS